MLIFIKHLLQVAGKLLHVKLILDENPPFSRPILSEEIFLKWNSFDLET